MSGKNGTTLTPALSHRMGEGVSIADLVAQVELLSVRLGDLEMQLGALRGALLQPARGVAAADQQDYHRACEIADRVCEFFGYRRAAIFAKERTEPIVWARHLAWYLIEEELRLNNCQLGRLLGIEHSTIRHGVTKVRHRLQTDRKAMGHLRELTTNRHESTRMNDE